ncbi:helix-turn-helix domain-containing protein [Telluribacter humicola]|uniref:helix-turn-helix domain-containing protein n=1 Tax=Telluribacter humicola TaxID=1720261 RepID=UPI001A974FEA|nr:helix-turn-helix domain-containing protein [Telluribacter humicola]
MPFSTEEELEVRLNQVSALYLKGMPQYKIAEKVGVSPSQVSRDLDMLRDRWRQVNMDNMNDIILEQLNKLDVMEKELWEAWDRSKLDYKETRIKGKGKAKKKEGEEEGREETQNSLQGEVTKITKEKEPNVGFMVALLQLMERRSKLLGMDAGLQTNEKITVTIKA